MPSHYGTKYEMRMLPNKSQLEQPQSTRLQLRGVPSIRTLPGIPSGDELAANTRAGALGSNLTVTQKKLIAFVAGVAVGMFIRRRR